VPKYHQKLERGGGCLWVSLAFPHAPCGGRRPAQVSKALCEPERWHLAEPTFQRGLGDPRSGVALSFTPKSWL